MVGTRIDMLCCQAVLYLSAPSGRLVTSEKRRSHPQNSNHVCKILFPYNAVCQLNSSQAVPPLDILPIELADSEATVCSL